MQFSSRYVVKDGKLCSTSKGDQAKYNLMLQSLPEGTMVDVFMSVEKDDATLSQLAKVHAMCKTLADHTGNTFDEMKLYVKDKAGLVLNDGTNVHVKSFGKCSKEELSMAIQAAQEIGELVNCLVD